MGLQRGSLFEPSFTDLVLKKKGAGVEAPKLMTFVRVFGGASDSGEACLTMQILHNGASVQSRLAPFRERRILWAAPSAAGP